MKATELGLNQYNKCATLMNLEQKGSVKVEQSFNYPISKYEEIQVSNFNKYTPGILWAFSYIPIFKPKSIKE